MDVVSGAASQIFFFPSKSGGRGRGPSGRVRGHVHLQMVVNFFFAHAREFILDFFSSRAREKPSGIFSLRFVVDRIVFHSLVMWCVRSCSKSSRFFFARAG